ncbi:MAG: hypothetical protein V8S69_00895 [Dakarella massiliensis]
MKNEGVDELVEHAIHVAHYQERPGRQDFCDVHDHGGAVHRRASQYHAPGARPCRGGGNSAPVRGANKLVEGDRADSRGTQSRPGNEVETIDHIVTQMERERGLDRAAAIADMRYIIY